MLSSGLDHYRNKIEPKLFDMRTIDSPTASDTLYSLISMVDLNSEVE